MQRLTIYAQPPWCEAYAFINTMKRAERPTNELVKSMLLRSDGIPHPYVQKEPMQGPELLMEKR